MCYILTLCLGLLVGKIKVSGEGRLKMSFCEDSYRVNEEETGNPDTVKEKIHKLIQMAATSEGLVNMRVKLDQINLFDTFVMNTACLESQKIRN